MSENQVENSAVEAAPTRTRSEGVVDSWKNPEVAAARSQRNSVIVDGVQYRSVTEAFKTLDLPLNRHIAFRAQLKKEGTKDFTIGGEGEQHVYHFEIAPPIKAEPKSKKPRKAKSESAEEAEVAQ